MSTLSISKSRCRELISRFDQTQILVLGDAMLDEYWWGDVTRISPEAPVPIVEVVSTTLKLGGAANVAANLKGLGISTVLVSIAGDDPNGARLGSLISEAGMPVDGIVLSTERPTTLKTRILASHQQVVRADHESRADLSDSEFATIISRVKAYIGNVKAVILSDYGKGLLSPRVCKGVINLCREKNIFVAVDPKKRFFKDYSGANLITPNLKEAYSALGLPVAAYSEAKVQEIGWELVQKNNIPALLITLGEKGMALFEQATHAFTHLETVAKRVYDVTGAGDTVISCFTAAMAVGATSVEAAWLANHAAGLTVAELGTATVAPEALLASL